MSSLDQYITPIIHFMKENILTYYKTAAWNPVLLSVVRAQDTPQVDRSTNSFAEACFQCWLSLSLCHNEVQP